MLFIKNKEGEHSKHWAKVPQEKLSIAKPCINSPQSYKIGDNKTKIWQSLQNAQQVKHGELSSMALNNGSDITAAQIQHSNIILITWYI